MVSLTDSYDKANAPIYVIGDQGADGFFQITSNSSPVELGDIRTSSAQDFLDAVSGVLGEKFPDNGLVILASSNDGDVQERTYAPVAQVA